MKKLLAVIVNYGDEQLSYLQQVVTELKNFKKYDVTVIVNSNIELDMINDIDHVNIIQLNDYQLLPSTCKQVIYDNKNEYDLFLFSENDHLWQEHHIDNHLRYSSILPKDRIPGLIQFEKDSNGNRSYCAFQDNHFIRGSKETYGKLNFCMLSNIHQASFLVTKEQLNRVIKYNKLYFSEISNTIKTLNYSVKCRVNTDLYEFSNWEKVICISEFDQNLIHHLPNLYVDGTNGRSKFYRDHDTMIKWIKEI